MDPSVVSSVSAYGPVLFLVCLAGAVGTGVILVTHLVGKRRSGKVKDSPYESGMPPVGDARQQFHVRFYLVAVLFLLFDVEIIFLWPWAQIYYLTATAGQGEAGLAGQLIQMGFDKAYLAGIMLVFVGFLLVGFVYEWRKGAFRWS